MTSVLCWTLVGDCDRAAGAEAAAVASSAKLCPSAPAAGMPVTTGVALGCSSLAPAEGGGAGMADALCTRACAAVGVYGAGIGRKSCGDAATPPSCMKEHQMCEHGTCANVRCSQQRDSAFRVMLCSGF